MFHNKSKNVSGTVFCEHRGYTEAQFGTKVVKDRAAKFWLAGSSSSIAESSVVHALPQSQSGKKKPGKNRAAAEEETVTKKEKKETVKRTAKKMDKKTVQQTKEKSVLSVYKPAVPDSPPAHAAADALEVDAAHSHHTSSPLPPPSPRKIHGLLEHALMPKQESLSSSLEPQDGSSFEWTCTRCTLKNKHLKAACTVCNASRSRGTCSADLQEAKDLVGEFYESVGREVDGPPAPPPAEAERDDDPSMEDESDILAAKCKAALDFRNSFFSFYKGLIAAKEGEQAKGKGKGKTKASKSASAPSFIVPYSVLCDLLPCKGDGGKCRRRGELGFEFCRVCRPYYLAVLEDVLRGEGGPGWGGDRIGGGGEVEQGAAIAAGTVVPAEPHSPSRPPKQRIVPWSAINAESTLDDGNPPPLWKVRTVEDAIIHSSLPSSLLPLGLRVRRFFDGYGFFDASITQIKRVDCNVPPKHPYPHERTKSNFVDLQYVYRVRYFDGDEEVRSGAPVAFVFFLFFFFFFFFFFFALLFC